MMYFGATGINFGRFLGATGASNDEVILIQDNNPLMLEQRVNARGRQEMVANGRYLLGIQIDGAGKGGVFTVKLIMSSANVPAELITAVHRFTPDDSSAGLGVFLYAGDIERELNVQKQNAIRRIRAWVSGFVTPEWRGFEIAGANDGGVAMGMFLMYRAVQG